eukprot:Rmarinus@m.17244
MFAKGEEEAALRNKCMTFSRQQSVGMFLLRLQSGVHLNLPQTNIDAMYEDDYVEDSHCDRILRQCDIRLSSGCTVESKAPFSIIDSLATADEEMAKVQAHNCGGLAGALKAVKCLTRAETAVESFVIALHSQLETKENFIAEIISECVHDGGSETLNSVSEYKPVVSVFIEDVDGKPLENCIDEVAVLCADFENSPAMDMMSLAFICHKSSDVQLIRQLLVLKGLSSIPLFVDTRGAAFAAFGVGLRHQPRFERLDRHIASLKALLASHVSSLTGVRTPAAFSVVSGEVVAAGLVQQVIQRTLSHMCSKGASSLGPGHNAFGTLMS